MVVAAAAAHAISVQPGFTKMSQSTDVGAIEAARWIERRGEMLLCGVTIMQWYTLPRRPSVQECSSGNERN